MLTTEQESPHEHQQNLLLSRIITNVVSVYLIGVLYGMQSHTCMSSNQEKLNEAVVVMNRTLQVRPTRLFFAESQSFLTTSLSRISTFKT